MSQVGYSLVCDASRSRHVQVVSICDRFRIDVTFFDERVHLPDADASSGYTGFVDQLAGDTTRFPPS